MFMESKDTRTLTFVWQTSRSIRSGDHEHALESAMLSRWSFLNEALSFYHRFCMNQELRRSTLIRPPTLLANSAGVGVATAR
jgi:hypothetical protein